jgi:membrane protease YdiL (CAAX protease family)
VAAFAVVALARAEMVGASWQFDPTTGAQAALLGLPVVLALMASEELIFRGYAFQKAEQLWGPAAALVGSSLAFGAYHVVGSEYWGMGAFFLFLTPTLGGLVFGLAALRTRSLALPFGLHLGGNWVNASLLGLGVPSGRALWAAPLDPSQVTTLMAPDVWPRLPYLIAVAVLFAAVALWPPRRRTAAPLAL